MTFLTPDADYEKRRVDFESTLSFPLPSAACTTCAWFTLDFLPQMFNVPVLQCLGRDSALHKVIWDTGAQVGYVSSSWPGAAERELLGKFEDFHLRLGSLKLKYSLKSFYYVLPLTPQRNVACLPN